MRSGTVPGEKWDSAWGEVGQAGEKWDRLWRSGTGCGDLAITVEIDVAINYNNCDPPPPNEA